MTALIALAVLCLTGVVIQDRTAQPASRYLLTVAIVDDSSVTLDPYKAYLKVDQADVDGRIYSDKAPYQPLLAAPAYGAYRLFGGDAFPPGFELDSRGRVETLQNDTNYGLWWVTLWSSTIPAAALAIVLWRALRRTHPGVAAPVALATVLGTTLLPFAGWLFGHVLAALFVTAAWALLRADGVTRSTGRTVLAGVAVGLGIGTEYTVALIAALLLAQMAGERRWRPVLALSGGTVVATLPLLAYNWLVFKSPFETSYQGNLKNFEGEGALGVYNLQGPRLEELRHAFVGQRGVFALTPIVLAAVIAAVVVIVRRGAHRRDAWLGLAALGAMAVASTGIDGLGGSSPGPRYLIPALPLLAVPMADAWQRAPRLCTVAAVVGAGWMWIASVATPGLGSDEDAPLRFWLDRLRVGDLETNVITGDSHTWVHLVAATLGVLAAGAAVWTSRVRPTEPRPSGSEERASAGWSPPPRTRPHAPRSPVGAPAPPCG